MLTRLALCLTAGAALLSCGPKVPPPPLDPWSDEVLAKYAAEVIPAVEAIAGRRFESRPGVKWIEATTLSALMADETRRIFSRLYPGVLPDYVEAQAQRSQAQLGGLLGKFTPESDEVHLAREALVTGFALPTDGPQTAERAVKLVLAHELAHALQHDQSPMMDELFHCPDEEAFDAWRGVSEGFATWVEAEYARQQGWTAEFDRLTQAQGWDHRGLLDPSAFSIWSSYGLGYTAVDAWVGVNGKEWLWTTLFRGTPRDTAMLFRPDRYAPGDHPADPELLAALDGVESELGKGPWNVIATRTGERHLREDAAYAEPGVLDRSLSTLEAAVQHSAFTEDRQTVIRLLRFQSDADAAHYVKVLAAMDLGAAKDAATRRGIPVEIELGSLPGFPEGTAWRRVRRIVGAPGLSGEVEVSWVSKGRHVATLEARGFRPGLRTAKALAAALPD